MPRLLPFDDFETQLPTAEVSAAIETALIQTGAIAEKAKKIETALEANGLGVEELTGHLSTLVFSAREGTKLKAIERAYNLHGIRFESKQDVDSKPQFVFNIQAENANVNTLFSPERS